MTVIEESQPVTPFGSASPGPPGHGGGHREREGRRRAADETPLKRWASSLPGGPMREGLTRMMIHYDQHGFAGGTRSCFAPS